MLDYDTSMRTGQSRYQDVLDLLAATGMRATFTQTGGMNAALEVLLGGGHTLLVTDAEEPLPWQREEHRGWWVGLYPPDRANTDGDCLAFASTEDGDPQALPPLLQQVLDSHLRRPPAGRDSR